MHRAVKIDVKACREHTPCASIPSSTECEQCWTVPSSSACSADKPEILGKKSHRAIARQEIIAPAYSMLTIRSLVTAAQIVRRLQNVAIGA